MTLSNAFMQQGAMCTHSTPAGALGISQQMMSDTLQAQNAITPSGVIETCGEMVRIEADLPIGVGVHLIGVVAALLPSGAPLGFVAILGVLALIRILIRNSVILVIQIEEFRHEGKSGWDAVIEATEHRLRPILLTAAAAGSLALIPIAFGVFWGPMAFAMMGGIIIGTVLTLPFLPALYIAWFRFAEPEPTAT